jgi:gas vesicle protein
MYSNNFFKGMGTGLAVGMAIGIAFSPKKKTRGTSGKFIKAVGDIVDNVSEFMVH